MKYLIPILFLFSSCRTVNKLFHKEKTSIDSTVVTHNVSIEEKHIDTTKTQTISSRKEKSVEIDLGNPIDTFIDYKYVTNNNITVLQDSDFTKGKTLHDYFVTINRKTGKITSNQPITHVTIKGLDEIKYSNFQEGIDSSVLKSETTDNTHLKKDVAVISKSVTKKVSFSTVIYWGIGILLFLLLLYFIYRYRNQIKSIILKATTGL